MSAHLVVTKDLYQVFISGMRAECSYEVITQWVR